jgi:hypothetical protein
MKHKDFNRLDRYQNGDIVDLYSIHHLLNEGQVDKLSDDDWSRYHEYQDELQMMLYEIA